MYVYIYMHTHIHTWHVYKTKKHYVGEFCYHFVGWKYWASGIWCDFFSSCILWALWILTLNLRATSMERPLFGDFKTYVRTFLIYLPTRFTKYYLLAVHINLCFPPPLLYLTSCILCVFLLVWPWKRSFILFPLTRKVTSCLRSKHGMFLYPLAAAWLL